MNIKQIAFAQRLGITRGYASILVSGEKPISQTVLNGIANCFPTANINWLLTGKGDMFLEKKEPPKPENGLLTGVMEAEAPRYEREKRIAVDDLAGIIEGIQREVLELREKVAEMERWRKEMEGKEE